MQHRAKHFGQSALLLAYIQSHADSNNYYAVHADLLICMPGSGAQHAFTRQISRFKVELLLSFLRIVAHIWNIQSAFVATKSALHVRGSIHHHHHHYHHHYHHHFYLGSVASL